MLLGRWNAVCVFDDAVEHCGEGAHKYLPACFPAFVDGITEVHININTQVLHKLSHGLSSSMVHPQPLNSVVVTQASPDASDQCRRVRGAYKKDFFRLLYTTQARQPSCWILKYCRSHRRIHLLPDLERNPIELTHCCGKLGCRFHTQEASPMLQMASVYGVQQTAKHAPAFFLPRVTEVSSLVYRANMIRARVHCNRSGLCRT